MSSVSVYSYTHSVVYLADNIHKSFKDILCASGLDPSSLMENRESTLLALRTWISSGDLKKVTLEIFSPTTDKLILRWDLNIDYELSNDDGVFYTDTDQLRYHILKAGIAPSQAKYRIVMDTKDGRPNVQGWGSTAYRSTENMTKQSLGSTIQHNGLGANAAYWRSTSC